MFKRCSRFTFPTSRARVGVLGGSFNPAHLAHLMVSRWAAKCLDLDFVLWAICDRNSISPKSYYLAQDDRARRARSLPLDRNILVGFSGSYSVDTVASLKMSYPQYDFVWIMGDDSWVEMKRWHRRDAFMASIPVAVFKRSSSLCRTRAVACVGRGFCGAGVIPRRAYGWSIFDFGMLSESSTAIREAGNARYPS